jgi:hypothetical protein
VIAVERMSAPCGERHPQDDRHRLETDVERQAMAMHCGKAREIPALKIPKIPELG